MSLDISRFPLICIWIYTEQKYKPNIQQFYWVIVHIRKSFKWNKCTMTGKGGSRWWTWEVIGPPIWEPGPHTGEPGPANQKYIFAGKSLYYRYKYSSVSSAVRVAGLRQSRRWRSRMWRSWAGVVAGGLRLWGRLDLLQNYLKRYWGERLMLEKLTFNSLAIALVDISAVSMTIAHALKTWGICDIVLCEKTAHFRVTFYCPQYKVHLYNDHAV